MSEHTLEYVDDFLSREIRAGCSCGWESVPVASRFGAADEWKAHVASAEHGAATQYAEVQRLREDVIPQLRAERDALAAKLQTIRELHTDSVAGVCPTCYRLADVSDTDDGLVNWPCPTILAADPDAGNVDCGMGES